MLDSTWPSDSDRAARTFPAHFASSIPRGDNVRSKSERRPGASFIAAPWRTKVNDRVALTNQSLPELIEATSATSESRTVCVSKRRAEDAIRVNAAETVIGGSVSPFFVR